MKPLNSFLNRKFVFPALMSGLSFVGCISSVPSAEKGQYVSFNKGEYLAISRIPSTNFYALGKSTEDVGYAGNKAFGIALSLGIEVFSNEEYLAVDNGDKIIDWNEEKQLYINRYSEEELRKGIVKRGVYENGVLVERNF